MYGSFLGCFIYIFFGSSKDVPIGPSAISSLLTYQSIKGRGPEHAILLTFLTGLVELAMGLLGLGTSMSYLLKNIIGTLWWLYKTAVAVCQVFLLFCFISGFIIDFVSDPVSSGFTSAVSLIIFTSQVKDILGIKAKGNTFLEIWTSLFQNMRDTTLWDPILGISCIVVLLSMRVSFKVCVVQLH